MSSSEPYYQATTDSRLGEDNKGHQLLTKMGQSHSESSFSPHLVTDNECSVSCSYSTYVVRFYYSVLMKVWYYGLKFCPFAFLQ